jgi:hypothetical protein
MKKLRDVVSLPHFAVSLVIVAAVSYPFAAFSGLPFWTCFAIVLGALLVNGLIAAWEEPSDPTRSDEKR